MRAPTRTALRRTGAALSGTAMATALFMVAPHTLAGQPERILLSPTADPATSQTVTWRAPPEPEPSCTSPPSTPPSRSPPCPPPTPAKPEHLLRRHRHRPGTGHRLPLPPQQRHRPDRLLAHLHHRHPRSPTLHLPGLRRPADRHHRRRRPRQRPPHRRHRPGLHPRPHRPPGVRFITLNSNQREAAPLNPDQWLQEQAQWLEQTLDANPHPWTVVTFHHPLFSNIPDRDKASCAEPGWTSWKNTTSTSPCKATTTPTAAATSPNTAPMRTTCTPAPSTP